jgi:integrase
MSRTTFRKVITSKESWEKVNIKNKELMKSFLKEKNIRSSDVTIKNYESDLTIFFTYVLEHLENKFFVDIKKIEFSDYFAWTMENLQWGGARFLRMRSCLSSLSQFIEKYYDDLYPLYRNIILKSIEGMPKVAKREKSILSKEQMNGLLNYLLEVNKIQEACWLALAISSGARFSELLRFTVDNIDRTHLAFNDIFIESLKPIKSKGRTKQGKMVTKYIIKDLFIPYYDKWLDVRSKILLDNKKDHQFLFIKNNGDPAEAGTIRSWINSFENFLSVPFYPHLCRHYATTYLSSIGLPSELIKELFGWESVSMVEIYDDQTAKDKSWKELDKLKDDLK